jgi:hypothetical protein
MQEISWPDEKQSNSSVLVDFVLKITKLHRPTTNVTFRFYRPRGAWRHVSYRRQFQYMSFGICETILKCIPPYRIKASDWLPNPSSCIRVPLVLWHVTSCRPTHYQIALVQISTESRLFRCPTLLPSSSELRLTSLGLNKIYNRYRGEVDIYPFYPRSPPFRILARRRILTDTSSWLSLICAGKFSDKIPK